MGMARVVVLALLVCAVSSVQAEEQDARLKLANSMLSEKSKWETAQEIYRAILSDEPENFEARMWLARTLSWGRKYEECAPQYAILLEHPNATREHRVEYAEVLSWAAEYRAARDAFKELLDDDPTDARSARGLARAYNWDGLYAEADRAYARALKLEEDPEARAEWVALRNDYPLDTGIEARNFRDSDGFSLNQIQTHAAYFPSLETRALVELGVFDVGQDSLGLPAGLSSEERALQLALGFERQFGENLRVDARVGARGWEAAGIFPQLHLGGRYLLSKRTVLMGSIDHRDFLEDSASLRAVQEDIKATKLGLSVWRGIGRQFDGFGILEVSSLSDSNTAVHVGVTGGYSPRPERLRISLGLDYLTFSDSSLFYYDPDRDLSAMLRGSYQVPLPGHLTLTTNAGAGYGSSDQGGVSGSGFAFDAGLRLAWVVGPWSLSIDGATGQTRRRSEYRSTSVGLALRRDF